jgi:hypothetical protein
MLRCSDGTFSIGSFFPTLRKAVRLRQGTPHFPGHHTLRFYIKLLLNFVNEFSVGHAQ